MSGPFLMPDLGEGLDEAVIVAVHVEEGDYVVADQPLLSVETDKAVVEIPSPASGVLERLAVKPGDTVKVGQMVAVFGDGGHRPSGSVVGELPTAEPSPPSPLPPPPAAAAAAPAQAVPAVRQLARRLGVDLAKVTGSGPGGAILGGDVEAAAAVVPRRGEALSGVRLAMARALDEAHRRVATATVSDEADVEGWVSGGDITVRLIRAVCRAVAAVPVLNSWYDDRALTLIRPSRVNLGLAVDTPDGLFVPVLDGVEADGPETLRNRLDVLRAEVESRTIAPERLRGATITLSNFGVFGVGLSAALMVVPPQVAIIGCGRLATRVVPAAGGGFAAHRHLPLSLTFDHRPVTGGEAARFLAALVEDLTAPG